MYGKSDDLPTAGLADRLAQKRRRILDEAGRHFMAQGFADTGIEMVARDAKVSTATLYSLFPSKTHLFNAVIEDAGEAFRTRIREFRRLDGSPRDRLQSFAVSYAHFMSDPFVRAVFRLVASERRRFTPVARDFYEMGRDQFGGALIALLKELQADGVVEAPAPATAAGQLLGMIEHPTFMVPLVTDGEIVCSRSPEEIAADAVETFLARYGNGRA